MEKTLLGGVSAFGTSLYPGSLVSYPLGGRMFWETKININTVYYNGASSILVLLAKIWTMLIVETLKVC